VNADGSGVRVLLSDYEPGGLAWSPDGATLAYATHGLGSDADGLWTVSAAASDPPVALATGIHIDDPVRSPDGRQVAFAGSTTGDHGWNAVAPDGEGPRIAIDQLTYLSWRGFPAFSIH